MYSLKVANACIKNLALSNPHTSLFFAMRRTQDKHRDQAAAGNVLRGASQRSEFEARLSAAAHHVQVGSGCRRSAAIHREKYYRWVWMSRAPRRSRMSCAFWDC